MIVANDEHIVFAVTQEDNHRRECLNKKHILLTSQTGYIASSVSDVTGHGTSNCPWVIEVHKGQKINVTLMDFGLWQRQQNEDGTSSLYCHKYAMIQEGDQRQQTTICASNERQKMVYLSKGNKLTITIARSMGDGDVPQFILKYEGKRAKHTNHMLPNRQQYGG